MSNAQIPVSEEITLPFSRTKVTFRRATRGDIFASADKEGLASVDEMAGRLITKIVDKDGKELKPETEVLDAFDMEDWREVQKQISRRMSDGKENDEGKKK